MSRQEKMRYLQILQFSYFFFSSSIVRHSISVSNTLETRQSLTLESTLVSPNKMFELGFFPIGSKLYLGLWFKADREKRSLWVANRNDPLLGAYGTLQFLENNLVVLNRSGVPVWSTNLGGRGVRSQMLAELVDNGNLVLKDANNPTRYLWQSFEHPTDTLLPEMKLDASLESPSLYSWMSLDDPSARGYALRIKYDFIFAIYIGSLGHDNQSFRIDTWNGHQFGDMPAVFQLIDDNRPSFIMKSSGNGHYSRFTLETDGSYGLHMWVREINKWNLTWSVGDYNCFWERTERNCGSYSFCFRNGSCDCIPGFIPKQESRWAGCIRTNVLNCTGDRFIKLQNMKLPENARIGTGGSINSVEKCEKSCLASCHCTAFSLVENPENKLECVEWTSELNDMRNYTFGGHDLYIRVAATDMGKGKGKGKKMDTWIIVVIAGLITMGTVIVSYLGFYCWKRHTRRIQGGSTTQTQTQTEIIMNQINRPESFQIMEFGTIAEATDHFSLANKLGQGGFGSVYKGTLPDGTEIAVKRLKARSSQGLSEFKNEVTLILRVLHVNLVRLLGCCIEGNEKLLIYEYLENSSLNRYLFNKTQSPLLNWGQRYNIIKGIAEGLSYLHNFTTPPIIHRDLKPSNVLLGKDMVPKISDFGLVQMLEAGTTEAETETPIGTYGYMSEECARYHIMSEKSDIFSYGVMLLEIITGIRNLEYCHAHHDDSLLDYVWRQWDEGHGLEVVDSNFVDASFVADQVLKSIQIGLTCVQKNVHDRPNTKSVVLMLESTQSEIPKPTRPNYYLAKSIIGERASSSSATGVTGQSSDTINYATFSLLECR